MTDSSQGREWNFIGIGVRKKEQEISQDNLDVCEKCNQINDDFIRCGNGVVKENTLILGRGMMNEVVGDTTSWYW